MFCLGRAIVAPSRGSANMQRPLPSQVDQAHGQTRLRTLLWLRTPDRRPVTPCSWLSRRTNLCLRKWYHAQQWRQTCSLALRDCPELVSSVPLGARGTKRSRSERQLSALFSSAVR
eukprot:2091712-Rhodomonas_salina.1